MGNKVNRKLIIILISFTLSCIACGILLQTGLAIYFIDSFMIVFGLINENNGIEHEHSRNENIMFVWLLVSLFVLIFSLIYLLVRYYFFKRKDK